MDVVGQLVRHLPKHKSGSRGGMNRSGGVERRRRAREERDTRKGADRIKDETERGRGDTGKER